MSDYGPADALMAIFGYKRVRVMNENLNEQNYGWICPKCGCPNAPTNKTCVACFSPEVIQGDTDPPEYELKGIKPFNPLNPIENLR